jgi:hypothetical protein
MKRQLTAVLAILAVAGGMGWKLARHAQSSVELRDIKLIQRSEHSQPGPTDALAGIRIRLSPSDFDDQLKKTAHNVPHVALAGE